MNCSDKVVEIEVCLKLWVTLLPVYDICDKPYQRIASGHFIRILQELQASLPIYLKNLIDVKLNSTLNIESTMINSQEFQKHFNMRFPEERQISSEEGACLLLYTMDRSNLLDPFQSEILIKGCLKSVTIGGCISKKPYNRHGIDCSSNIEYILFKGNYSKSKEENHLLVPQFLHQQKTSSNFKLLDWKHSGTSKSNRKFLQKGSICTERQNSCNKNFFNTESVNIDFLFYQCPMEHTMELEKMNLDSVWNIISVCNVHCEDKEISDIEYQFRHTSFGRKNPNETFWQPKKIYSDIDEDVDEQIGNICKGFSKVHQPKLTNALLELNTVVTMENTSLRASDFITITPLPCPKLIGSWEKLKMDGKLKENIYANIQVLLTLSELFEKEGTYTTEQLLELDKLLLLHGSPGTGKSSLAKALFQKFSVKAVSSIKEAVNLPPILLLELSPDRIFSRYYGESPKKLSMIFAIIENTLKGEMSSRNGGFIFMIIDEVETLATDRSKLLANNETADGVRMVNILLTHLDKLKHFKNFFMVGTSNLIESVDSAFKDRASALYRLPLPNDTTIYSILEQQITHFLDLGILGQKNDVPSIGNTKDSLSSQSLTHYSSKLLFQIATYCSNKQISSRSVSRLPMITLTQMLQSNHIYDKTHKFHLAIEEFLVDMARIVADENV